MAEIAAATASSPANPARRRRDPDRVARQTFLVMRKQLREPPSNIAQLPIFQYADQGTGWQSRDVPRLARFIRWTWKHHVASVTAEHVIEDASRQLIRYLRVTSRPVPAELLTLAGAPPEPGTSIR